MQEDFWSSGVKKYVLAYNNRGIILGSQGKNSEALDDFNQVLTLKPDYFYLIPFNLPQILLISAEIIRDSPRNLRAIRQK